MYLKKFVIINFRAIKSLTLDFNKDVNVLIGENNSGKSSIIDALRICLGYGKQIREIGVKITDFYIDRNKPLEDRPNIEFHLHFKINDPLETRYFYEMLHQDKDDISSQEIQLHFRYYIEKKDEKEIVRWKLWGGTNEGQPVNYDSLRFIDYTFLDALRDATQKLRPYSQQNKLAQLFENLITFKDKDGKNIILDKDKKKEFADKLETWLKDKDNEWKYLILEGQTNVNKHLHDSDIEGEQTPIDIAFSGYDYKDIVSNLQLRIPIFSNKESNENELKYFNLNQNGLGQNNLIYAATILGDLLNKKAKGHYHALLIEEPEAHLHPQKQNTFFKYLNDLKGKEIQIFITSHSPTITAKTDLEFVTVLHKDKNEISSLALKESSLTLENRKYLGKFLDVTKSQLFFAKGIILVEGISEALLLPIFSKFIGYDLMRHGIEIVNVNGTSFNHFINLFIAKDQERKKSLNSYCAVLTDNDQHRYSGNKSDRARNVEEICENVDKVLCRLAQNTFEYELFVASEFNARLIRFIYEKMHTKTKLKRSGTLEEKAVEFLNELDKKKDKAEFAHNMAILLEKIYPIKCLINEFKVPSYIEIAIKWVVNGSKN